MKKTLTLIMMALFLTGIAFAQTTTEKPKKVAETQYMMPKRGMEAKFEAAVKAHNSKFHPDGPFVAGLRKVDYGDKAGWYIFVYGPTNYASIDSRPAKENGHDADWTATIDPLVETYGESSLWNYNEDLSYGIEKLKTAKYYEARSLKLKPGEYYRFKALAEKLKKAYETDGKYCFVVYNNPLHTANSADVAILYNFDSYEEWSNGRGIKAAYDKLYGENSYENMRDEWRAVVTEYDTELRSFIR